MDIDQLKTFLAVVETGSFLGASRVVHVTQSTVSIRIRTLEQSLNCQLFDRSKSGASLTLAGQRFLSNATAMVRLWNQSRLDVGKSKDQDIVLRVGAQQSLWDGYLVHWLGWMRKRLPNVVLRADIAGPSELMQGLADGALDVCVLYRPQHRPGFTAEKVFDEQIVLVTTNPNKEDVFDENYVMTYWGPDFQAFHALHFPEITMPNLTLDLGPLALDHILAEGGAGYFPLRIAQSHIESGKLFVLPNAPIFQYPAYVVWPVTLAEQLRSTLLAGLLACNSPAK